jgi:hypothetical protein
MSTKNISAGPPVTELESRNCQNRMEVRGRSSVITKLPSRPRLLRQRGSVAASF